MTGDTVWRYSVKLCMLHAMAFLAHDLTCDSSRRASTLEDARHAKSRWEAVYGGAVTGIASLLAL